MIKRPRDWRLYGVFFAIMAVATAMRLWRLGELPPAVFRDEAEKALNGWFLLHGGVDAAGRAWPVFIQVFGVTTSAIYQYATIPFLAIGGLNEWTTRLPAAFVGIATVALTWALVRRIWNWQTAAWAAALLAISPWHVPLSRWAQQGIFLPFFFTAAAYAVAKFMECAEKPEAQKNVGAAWLGLAGGCVALAMYAYDPARLFGPLLALAAAVIWWRVWVRNWRAVLVGLASFALFVSPVAWLMLNQGDAAMARFRVISIMQPGLGTGEIAWQFLRNYASHFSPDFLLYGDAELRHSGGTGVMGSVDLIFAVFGVVFVFMSKNRWGWFFLVWILLAPIPASLTREGVPHALRSQVALPAWQVLSAAGLMFMIRQNEISLRRKLNRGSRWYEYLIWPLLVLMNFQTFTTQYFEKYAAESAGNWQYGVKQALQYLNQPMTRNSQVVFQNIAGADYLVPFYLKMKRPEYRRMLAGQSRYHFAQPGAPQENWLTDPPHLPRAVVALRGTPRVEGSYNMFINGPGEKGRYSRLLEIFMTPELMKQIDPTTD